MIEGFVDDLEKRIERFGPSGEKHIWTFVIVNYDELGQPINRISVEIKNNSFEGMLKNGHKVKITKPKNTNYTGGKIIKAKEIYNISTNSAIKIGSGRSVGCVIVAIIIICFVVIVPTVLILQSGGVISIPILRDLLTWLPLIPREFY